MKENEMQYELLNIPPAPDIADNAARIKKQQLTYLVPHSIEAVTIDVRVKFTNYDGDTPETLILYFTGHIWNENKNSVSGTIYYRDQKGFLVL